MPEGPVELRTARLVLRQWRDDDREPWARLSADPEVMRHFPSPLTRAEADEQLDRFRAVLDAQRWGLWAVEVVDPHEPVAGFVGFVGLAVPSWEGPAFLPAVEVGWRLARWAWGRGYATEGARAAVAFGFGELALDEIVSFTVPANERSRAVMERLGMVHDPAGDFDHPRMPPGSPWRRHVLYRLARPG